MITYDKLDVTRHSSTLLLPPPGPWLEIHGTHSLLSSPPRDFLSCSWEADANWLLRKTEASQVDQPAQMRQPT